MRFESASMLRSMRRFPLRKRAMTMSMATIAGSTAAMGCSRGSETSGESRKKKGPNAQESNCKGEARSPLQEFLAAALLPKTTATAKKITRKDSDRNSPRRSPHWPRQSPG